MSDAERAEELVMRILQVLAKIDRAVDDLHAIANQIRQYKTENSDAYKVTIKGKKNG